MSAARARLRASALALLLGVATGCSQAPTPVGPGASLPAPVVVPRNEHGLEIVGRVGLLRELERRDPRRQLVDLADLDGIVLDLRYGTNDNFMAEVLYPVARAYLRAPAAEALERAAAELAAEGLGLKVFDAYRPYRVTKRMWDKVGDPDYVADPAKGSRHNRGAAVDVTLVSLTDGAELEMPTGYDDFTKRAHHDFEDLPDVARANRRRLRELMERHGFEALESEWWHYDHADWREYELLDVAIEELSDR